MHARVAFARELSPKLMEVNLSSKRIHWPHMLTVGGASILVATEVTALTWAAGWALGGLLGLPQIFALGLQLIGAGIGLTASYYFLRAALRVEPVITLKAPDEQGGLTLGEKPNGSEPARLS